MTDGGSPPDCLAVLLAAGSAQRFGTDKLRSDLGGRPLICWALAAMLESPLIGAVQLVGSDSNLAWLGRLQQDSGSAKLLEPCRGGQFRSESTLAGLESAGGEWEWALVHDAARPFLSQRLIGAGLDAARSFGAAIAAVPARDTVQIVDAEGLIAQSPPRSNTYLAQTPQIARRAVLLETHRRFADRLDRFTDEASLLRAAGHTVGTFAGDRNNLKITGPGDLVVARTILDESGRTTQTRS